MKLPLQSLTVVIPAFNEAARIGSTLRQVLDYCEQHVATFEIIVVDDGSTDNTAEVVAANGGERVRLLGHKRCAGKGRALRTGVDAAQLEWVLFLDADHAISIDELRQCIEPAADAPIVIGSKRMQGAVVQYRWWRRVLGLMSQWIIRVAAVRGVHDTQCGFKLLRTDVARGLFSLQTIEGFGYDFELLCLARRYGIAVREVPVTCRDAGDGSVRLASYLRTLGELLRLVRNRLTNRYPRDWPGAKI